MADRRAVIQVQVRTDAEELEDLEGDLRRVEEGAERVTPIDVDAQTSEASQGLNAVRDGLAGTERAAEESQQSIRGVGTSAEQAQSRLAEAIEQAESGFRGLGLRAERTGDQIRRAATGIQFDAGTQQARESLRRLQAQAQDVVQSVEAPAQVRLDATDSNEVLRRLGQRAEQTESRLRDLSAAATIDAETSQARRSLARLDGSVEELVSDVSQASPIRVRADTAAARRQLARTDTQVGGLVESAQRVSGTFEEAGLHSAQAIGEIGRSAEDAIQVVNNLGRAQDQTFSELVQRTGQARSAIDSMEGQYADLQRRVNLVDQDLEEATLQAVRMGEATEQAGEAMGTMQGPAAELGFLLSDLGTATTSWRTGLIGAANNLPGVVAGMSNMASSGTSLLSMFTGTGGLILAANALAGALPLLAGAFDDTSSSMDAAGGSASGANDEFRGLLNTSRRLQDGLPGLENTVSEVESRLQDISEADLGTTFGLFGNTFVEELEALEAGRAPFQRIRNIQDALRGSSEEAKILREALRTAGVDAERLLSQNLQEARSEIEQNVQVLRQLGEDPVQLIEDPAVAADAIRRQFEDVSDRLDEQVADDLIGEEEALDRQVRFLEERLRQASAQFDGIADEDAFAQLRTDFQAIEARAERLEQSQQGAATAAETQAKAVNALSVSAQQAAKNLQVVDRFFRERQQQQSILPDPEQMRRRLQQQTQGLFSVAIRLNQDRTRANFRRALSAMQEAGFAPEPLSFEDVFGTTPRGLMMGVRTELEGLEAFGQFTSDVERAQARVRLLEQALRQLKDQGVDPESAGVQELIQSLHKAREEANNLSETDPTPQAPQRPQEIEALSMSLQQIQNEYDVSKRKARQFKQTARQQFGRVANAAASMGSALVSALQSGKKEAEDIAGILLQGVGGVLSAIPGVGTIAGPVLSGLGGIVSSFQQGGVVRHPGVVRGPGGPRDDKIPAMLSDREFVVQAPSAMSAPRLLRAINEDPQTAQQVERLMQERQLAEAALARQTGQEPRGLAHGGFARRREETGDVSRPALTVAGGTAQTGESAPADQSATIGRTVDYHPGAAGRTTTPRPAPQVSVQAPALDLDPIRDEISRQTDSMTQKLDQVAQRVEQMEVRLDAFGARDRLREVESERKRFGSREFSP